MQQGFVFVNPQATRREGKGDKGRGGEDTPFVFAHVRQGKMKKGRKGRGEKVRSNFE